METSAASMSARFASAPRVGGPAGGHERGASGRRHEACRAARLQVPRTPARAASVLQYQIRIGGVATFSVRTPFGRSLYSGAGLTGGRQQRPSELGAGTHGALIFEDVRARLHALRPANAPSAASRSIQEELDPFGVRRP